MSKDHLNAFACSFTCCHSTVVQERFHSAQLDREPAFEYGQNYLLGGRIADLVNNCVNRYIAYNVEKDLQHIDVAYSVFKIFYNLNVQEVTIFVV